ncbi:hypothetical protein D3D01_18065 [Haloarcula sp. Atlit-7R]|nr:hypothetical protein D3D01_18065 [Haloarcula sp. Atlit-7R]
MGEAIPLGRACRRCGEQVVLTVETEQGVYTDDLEALLQTTPGQEALLRTECDCPTPRTVAVKGTTPPTPDEQ